MDYPYSDVGRHKEFPNYISDYPHWSRLLIYGGCLFNIFEKRTTSGDVIGARAAVRYLDTTSNGEGVAAGSQKSPRPKAFPDAGGEGEASLIFQPYFEQKSFMRSYNGDDSTNRPAGFYDEWSAPIAEDDAKVSKLGRFFVALVRMCSYSNQNSEDVILKYHPLSFDFETKPSDLNKGGTDEETLRIKWLAKFTKTCADRWNGNDGVNTSRAKFGEDITTDPKLTGQVVTFIRRVDRDHAHVNFETVTEDKTSFVNSRDGIGELRVAAGADSSGRGFAAAHELGHAGGQPDDYPPDRMDQTGFGSNNTPGAPYITDTKAMMFYNRQLRAFVLVFNRMASYARAIQEH